MKCLVINLDRSPDRLAHMTAEFARIGIAFERVAAIDARNRPDLADLPQRTAYTHRLQLAGVEIACLLSHKACWTMIAGGNDPYCAIFEDDVLFSSKAGILLADPGWIPADADIVKLETTFDLTMIGQPKRAIAGRNFSLSRLYKAHPGSAGYIVSRQAARDLIHETAEMRAAIDDLVFNPAFRIASRKTIYQLDPALCAQDHILGNRSVGLPSTIEQDRAPQLTPAQLMSGGNERKREKRIGERLAIELRRLGRQINDISRRLGRQINDIYLRKREKIIPFDHRGELVLPSHTQRRKNAP